MYALYNRELKRFLKHPKDGIWASESFDDAEKVLNSAKQYVAAIGVPEIADHLTIMEVGIDLVQDAI
jgi:hypothetical protein